MSDTRPSNAPGDMSGSFTIDVKNDLGGLRSRFGTLSVSESGSEHDYALNLKAHGRTITVQYTGLTEDEARDMAIAICTPRSPADAAPPVNDAGRPIKGRWWRFFEAMADIVDIVG